MSSLLILTGLLATIASVSIWFYRKFLEPYIGTVKRQKFFAEYLKEVGKMHNEKVKHEKKILFKGLLNIKSHKKHSTGIRILEIGAGTGINLEYYPPNCQLVVVEPNPFVEKNLIENLKKYPGIKLEKFVLGKAEDMNSLEDASFDAVVSTLVCCNVDSVGNTYREIKRLLVPGGKYFYMDHILDVTGTWLYWTQIFLDYFKIWTFFFDGCHLSRQQDFEITKIGFSNIEQKRFYIDTSGPWVWKIVQRHCSGVVTK